MQTFVSYRIALVAVLVALCLCDSSAQAPPIQTPQFRAGVTLVPVEVRVVDRDGNPVRDLTKADFEVRDDGRAQEIALFQTVAVDDKGSPSGRTFVIVLGRGRLNIPTKAVQALADFVRAKLAAPDRVAVAAYNRIIEPTTNYEGVAKFLESFRDVHVRTEGLIARDQRGPQPRTVKADTIESIDTLFRRDNLGVQDLPGASSQAPGPYNDVNYLRAALSYLRTIAGEKHVIVVTERTFLTGWTESSVQNLNNFWFRQATSARSALHFLHTGGLPPPEMVKGTLVTGNLDPSRLEDLLRRKAQQLAAEQTGGTSTFFQFADKPLAELDRATRFHYLIGFYPSRELPPDQYRDIAVSVTRPGAQLMYRRSYQAQPKAEVPADYRRAITANRIDDFVNWMVNPQRVRSISGWGMRLKVAASSPSASGNQLRVEMAFDPLMVDFAKNGDRYIAELSFALLADDDRKSVVGEIRQDLTLDLTTAEFEQTKREWLTVDIAVTTKSKPEYLRAVIYQFDSDRLGWLEQRLR